MLMLMFNMLAVGRSHIIFKLFPTFSHLQFENKNDDEGKSYYHSFPNKNGNIFILYSHLQHNNVSKRV